MSALGDPLGVRALGGGVSGSSAAPGTTIAGALATETDAALAGTAIRVIPGAQATETDSANAGRIGIAGSQATETDTALNGTEIRIVAGGQALEYDFGRPGSALGGVEPAAGTLVLSEVTLKVYDGQAPLTLLASDIAASNVRFLVDLNETGGGGFDLQRDDAQAVHMVDGNIVRCYLDGQLAFAWVIEPSNQRSLDPGEEAAELLHVEGRGLLSLWEDDVVYPELGIGRRSPEHRLFTFASADYVEDASWVAATEIKRQGDFIGPTPSAPYEDLLPGQWDGDDPADLAPAGFDDIDGDAYWISTRAQSTVASPPMPVGSTYLRKRFYNDTAGDVKLFASADDGYRLYLDGEEVDSQTQAYMWRSTNVVDYYLDVGWHVLAVELINIDRPNAPTNVSGFVFTMWRTTSGGQLSTLLLHSDSSWSALDYPAQAPTMTVGEILAVLLAESQALGGLTNLSLSCNAFTDSRGNPWGTSVDVGYPIGTTVLDVIRHLIEVADIDVEMDPETLTLHVYNRPGGADLSASVTLAGGADGSLTQLQHDRARVSMNAGLTRDTFGVYRLYEDAGSIATFGRRTAYVSLGTAPSEGQIDRTMAAILAETGAARDRYSFGALPLAGVAPWADFWVGDTIGIEDRDGVPADVLVESMAVTTDDNSYAVFAGEGVAA